MIDEQEKDICKNCLYSEYDYDGEKGIFLGCCRTTKKCKGAIQPKTQEFEIERNGITFAFYQTEWLSYEGKTINLAIFLKDEKGKWQECLHSGHFGEFIKKEWAEKYVDSVIRLWERER